MRWWLLGAVLIFSCGQAVTPVPDAGQPEVDAGAPDAGAPDAGATDAGVYEVPVVKASRSLFWNEPALLDDPQLVSFSKLMATIAPDGHGGALLKQWFSRFATTAHSERAHPAQFIDELVVEQGADPTKWNLALLPFKVTGVHNRMDLAQYGAGGHCGELRVSVSSTAVNLQPFHMLFLFRQPRDTSCTLLARRWADLSRLDGEPLRDAVRALWREGFTRERFEMVETVEFTLAPWEWRQWVKGPPAAGLAFTLENQPLFQQLDVEGLNMPGPRRDAMLQWVADNATALDERTLLFPEQFRAPSVRVNQGVPRVPLSLAGLRADVAAQYPNLRKNIEVTGCAACHTADADFVQTRTNRTVSPFYEKELLARERHLEQMARGLQPFPPFGPLQTNPLLPD